MRTLSVVVLAMCVAVAMAGAGEHEVETDNELAVPTLPGMDQGCLPKYSKRNYRSHSWKKEGRRIVSFGGKCVADASCSEAQSEPGYCAGLGVTCCKGVFAAAPTYLSRRERRAAKVAARIARATGVAPVTAAGQMPVLKSGTTPCASQGGSCIDVATCTAPGTTKSGLCPGTPNNIKCCFRASAPTPVTPTPTPVTPTPTPVFPSMPLTTLIKIPAGINSGVSIAGASVLISKLGTPGCPLSTSCFSCTCRNTNALIGRNTVTLQVTPTVKLTGLKPFVTAIKAGLDAMFVDAATNPQLMSAYTSLKTAGGLCCRPIKHSDGTAGSSWSNHSWGCAADFYFGANIDPRGDGKCQFGLSLIAPYLNKQKLYWAAGYRGSEEDAMHFEASVESLNAWAAAGQLK